MRQNGLMSNKSGLQSRGYPQLWSPCCRQTAHSALSASPLRRSLTLLRTSHSVRARKQSASTEFVGASQTSIPTRRSGNPTASPPGALQKGPEVVLLSTTKELFLMRSLATVLGPRQRQGGTGPEPKASSQEQYHEPARACDLVTTSWSGKPKRRSGRVFSPTLVAFPWNKPLQPTSHR